MERSEYEKQAKEKGESIQTVSVIVQEEKEGVLDDNDDEEEGSFDFDAMSEEEGMEQKPAVVKEKPVQVEPVPAPVPSPVPAPVEDEDGSEGT